MESDIQKARPVDPVIPWIEWFAWCPAGLGFLWLCRKTSWFWNSYPELQFGWIVAALCVFLFWDAWPNRPATRFCWTGVGFCAAVAGFAFLMFAQLYSATFGFLPSAVVGMALGVFAIAASNCLFIYGWPGVRHFAFPLGFLLIALPVPSVIYVPVVGGLQNVVACIDVTFLNLVGVPASQSGNLIRIPAGLVGIDEACSGIRSLQSTIMATLFIGYLSFKSRGLQVLLLATGVFLAIAGNVVRSLFLSLIANKRGIGAIQIYHDAAGWSILAFTVAGVILAAWLFSRVERKVAAARKEAGMSARKTGND